MDTKADALDSRTAGTNEEASPPVESHAPGLVPHSPLPYACRCGCSWGPLGAPETCPQCGTTGAKGYAAYLASVQDTGADIPREVRDELVQASIALQCSLDWLYSVYRRGRDFRGTCEAT